MFPANKAFSDNGHISVAYSVQMSLRDLHEKQFFLSKYFLVVIKKKSLFKSFSNLILKIVLFLQCVAFGKFAHHMQISDDYYE